MLRKSKKFLLGVYYSVVPALPAFASNAGPHIIDKLQGAAFWFGLALAIWGLYEWMMGSDAGWERVKKAVLGYILILIIPLGFIELREAFSVKTYKW